MYVHAIHTYVCIMIMCTSSTIVPKIRCVKSLYAPTLASSNFRVSYWKSSEIATLTWNAYQFQTPLLCLVPHPTHHYIHLHRLWLACKWQACSSQLDESPRLKKHCQNPPQRRSVKYEMELGDRSSSTSWINTNIVGSHVTVTC